MGSVSLLIVAALAASLLGLILVLLFLRRSLEVASRMDPLLREIAAARQASESVDRRFEDLRRSVEERVEGVETRLVEGQKSIADHLGSSARLLKDVGESIGKVFDASQKIEKLAGEVTRLEDLLKPPKLRGALGEAFLEQALAQVLPPGAWKMGYLFPDGAVVDAAVSIGDRVVAIDSKFPLENYRRSQELPEEGERKRARKDFGQDVRKHVNSIAEKYIRPGSGTFDFALMYVPAEAVYCEIVADGEEGALADYAIEKHVIPVSPRLLYAYLSTVAIGLRGLELQDNAREIHSKLADLARLWERLQGPFEKLGMHLTNAQKQYEEASQAFGRFGRRLEGIAEKEEEKVTVELEVPPLLPPS